MKTDIVLCLTLAMKVLLEGPYASPRQTNGIAAGRTRFEDGMSVANTLSN